MKRQFFAYLLTLLAMLCGMSACTTVELCPEVDHPHVANVRARFHWTGVNEADIPAEMNIVASRIINTWRTHGIATTTPPEDGENIFEQHSSAGFPEPDDDANNNSFYLRGGEYNIFAINNQKISTETEKKPSDDTDTPQEPSEEETPQEPGEEVTRQESGEEETPQEPGEEETPQTPAGTAIEIENLDNYINDTRINVNELYLHIKSMGKDVKPAIVTDNDLPDFNPNYEYLENVNVPIFHAVNKGVSIETGQETIIDFDMQRVSLGVNIIFKIQLKANSSGERVSVDDLDSPIVELSGICGRFNISEAYLDTTKLYRMAQKIVKPKDKQDMEPAAGEDGKRQDFVKESEDTYRCTARFNTLGVIPSSSKNHLNGSGIVQVAVKVWSDVLDDQGNKVLDEEGNPKRIGRYVYAGINIRDELMAERLVEVRDGKTYMRYSKDDVNVEVNLPLIIEKDKIVPDDSGMGWIPFDPTDPDGDIDIEI